jgi:hypothetical protein
MYQLEVLATEHIRDLRREAEQARAAAGAPRIAVEPGRIAATRIAGSTLVWAGRRLTDWGTQLQREYRKPAYN